LEWEGPCPPRPQNDNRERFLNGGLGCPLQWGECRRSVESIRSVSPHKLSGTSSRLLCDHMLRKTNIHIQLLMDNVTALTLINKMGGTKSRALTSLSHNLWQWCLQRQITVSATHIPGILNVNADRESRHHLDSSDWKLCPVVFQTLQNLWGPLELDLFTSRLTNQLPQTLRGKQ